MNKETPLLITSQIKPDASNAHEMFAILALPNKIDDFIEPIVEENLEPTNAKRLVAHIATSGLTSSIRNGYDVKLIVDLALRGLS